MLVDHRHKDNRNRRPNKYVKNNTNLETSRLLKSSKDCKRNNTVLKRKDAYDLGNNSFSIHNQEERKEYQRKRKRKKCVVFRNNVCKWKEFLRIRHEHKECGNNECIECIKVRTHRKCEVMLLHKSRKKRWRQNYLYHKGKQRNK